MLQAISSFQLTKIMAISASFTRPDSDIGLWKTYTKTHTHQYRHEAVRWLPHWILCIFIYDLVSKTRVYHLQHYLKVFHVSLLSLDQLMDVTLSLLLLGAHRVQIVQVCTPCRGGGTHKRKVSGDCFFCTDAFNQNSNHYLNHSNTLAQHLLPPAGHMDEKTKQTWCCCSGT